MSMFVAIIIWSVSPARGRYSGTPGPRAGAANLIYIYIYVHIHIYVHTHIHIYIYTYIHFSLCPSRTLSNMVRT